MVPDTTRKRTLIQKIGCNWWGGGPPPVSTEKITRSCSVEFTGRWYRPHRRRRSNMRSREIRSTFLEAAWWEVLVDQRNRPQHAHTMIRKAASRSRIHDALPRVAARSGGWLWRSFEFRSSSSWSPPSFVHRTKRTAAPDGVKNVKCSCGHLLTSDRRRRSRTRSRRGRWLNEKALAGIGEGRGDPHRSLTESIRDPRDGVPGDRESVAGRRRSAALKRITRQNRRCRWSAQQRRDDRCLDQLCRPQREAAASGVGSFHPSSWIGSGEMREPGSALDADRANNGAQRRRNGVRGWRSR